MRINNPEELSKEISLIEKKVQEHTELGNDERAQSYRDDLRHLNAVMIDNFGLHPYQGISWCINFLRYFKLLIFTLVAFFIYISVYM